MGVKLDVQSRPTPDTGPSNFAFSQYGRVLIICDLEMSPIDAISPKAKGSCNKWSKT